MLNLYRRHLGNDRCPAGHAPDSQTYQSDEQRPKAKKCGCPIYASGKLPGYPKFRRNTKRVFWDEARTVADTWERDALTGNDPGPVLVAAPEDGIIEKSIEDACAACRQEYETNDCAINTQRAYKTMTKKFLQFSQDIKGYVFMHQWRIEDVREFRAWWGGSPRTMKTNMALTKSFFELALENKWVKTNPARFRIKRNRAQREADAPQEKYPYTDAELSRMIAACRQLYFPKQPNGRYQWTGQDLEDFIWISVYTGLRISDVVTFHISRLAGDGDVHVRATKNGSWIDTWIPEWLEARIRERAKKFGPYIFGERKTKDPSVLTHPWRVRLTKLWKLCGPWAHNPTSHRFRHSFVRMLLERGVSAVTVAELIGDTEEVVRKSYSRWVPERQNHVRGVLKNAFSGKPQLVVMK
jgi:integrase